MHRLEGPASCVSSLRLTCRGAAGARQTVMQHAPSGRCSSRLVGSGRSSRAEVWLAASQLGSCSLWSRPVSCSRRSTGSRTQAQEQDRGLVGADLYSLVAISLAYQVT